MSAITKCCCFCAHYGRGECNLFVSEPTKRDPRTAGCKDWTFPFTELMAEAKDSLMKARDKHPDFVPPPTPDLAEGFAVDARWCAGAYPCLRNVLLSEVYEFLTEIAKGDLRRATEEAGDVIAVLYRALNGEGKQEESK